MRHPKLRPGQVGIFWPDKKPGREKEDDPFCLTWYDKKARQVRHRSLATANFQEACLIVADYALICEKPKHGLPEEISILKCLRIYWEERAKNLPSAVSTQRDLRLWEEFWGNRSVSELTLIEQRAFREFLGEGRLKSSTIDKILSFGSSALSWAKNHEMLTTFQKIHYVETFEEKRARAPKGTPITPAVAAQLIDAVTNKHLLVFIVIIACTLARPGAVLEMRREQFDSEENVINLNPVGRRQTKKYRATVPVCPTLRKWLLAEIDPQAHYVTYAGKPIRSITTIWEKAVRRAGLPLGTTPYSFRHGVARMMKRRKVPREQIGFYLGHLERGAAKTTSIYAPMEPGDCDDAMRVVEEFICEVKQHLRCADLDTPTVVLGGDTKGSRRNRLTPAEQSGLEELIMNGTGVTEICRQLGVTPPTVYSYRKKLTGNTGACPRRA